MSANSADPDKIPPYVAFHPSLRCMSKYCSLVSRTKNVNAKGNK